MQVSKLFLPEVTEAIENGDLPALETLFEDLHPSDIADLVLDLEPERVTEIVRMLRFPRGLEVFEHLELQLQADVLHHLGRTETIKILEELSPDDRVDLLRKLPESTIESLLPAMAQAEREDVRKLLRYEENSAGDMMTTEYAHLPIELTVAEALNQMRVIAPDSETIYYIYITDSGRRLLGTISLKDLVLARPQQTIKEIVSEDPIFVRVDEDQEDVAKALAKYDLLAVPVVDDLNRLVGIVTYDDAMDVVEEEQTEDAHRMGAIEPLEEPYFQSGFWSIAQKRGMWLILLFFGQFLTFWALRHYHAELKQAAVALLLFVPLIISSGGNSGSQSVTLITRGLAVGDVRLRDYSRVLWREAGMGLILGALLGGLGVSWAKLVLEADWVVCVSVGFSLVAVVTAGTLTGSLLPLAFKRLGFDPAIMSSPFVASIVDVVGVVIFFSVAQALLG